MGACTEYGISIPQHLSIINLDNVVAKDQRKKHASVVPMNNGTSEACLFLCAFGDISPLLDFTKTRLLPSALGPHIQPGYVNPSRFPP